MPVSLDAAKAVLDSAPTKTEILVALDVLLTQHLLMPSGEGHYELHPIVASYIQHGLEESDEQSSYQLLQGTHIKAANHYLQRATETCPPKGQRENIRDVYFLVEAVWHLCQGQQWQKAYELIRDENIFPDLKSWGENTTLLDLYQLLLPLNKWHPQEVQEADIYGELGEIHTEMLTTDGSHADEALQYFKLSFTLYSKLEDHKGKCSILRYMGKLYLMQVRYNVALAFFLLVEKLLIETQNAHEGEVQEYKEEICRLVGEKQYRALLLEVAPQVEQIVEKMMN